MIQLWTLHKVMISASIVMGLVLAFWAGFQYSRVGGWSHLAMAMVGVVASASLGAYLRYFIRARQR